MIATIAKNKKKSLFGPGTNNDVSALDRYNLWKVVFICRRNDHYDCYDRAEIYLSNRWDNDRWTF